MTTIGITNQTKKRIEKIKGRKSFEIWLIDVLDNIEKKTPSGNKNILDKQERIIKILNNYERRYFKINTKYLTALIEKSLNNYEEERKDTKQNDQTKKRQKDEKIIALEKEIERLKRVQERPQKEHTKYKKTEADIQEIINTIKEKGERKTSVMGGNKIMFNTVFLMQQLDIILQKTSQICL